MYENIRQCKEFKNSLKFISFFLTFYNRKICKSKLRRRRRRTLDVSVSLSRKKRTNQQDRVPSLITRQRRLSCSFFVPHVQQCIDLVSRHSSHLNTFYLQHMAPTSVPILHFKYHSPVTQQRPQTEIFTLPHYRSKIANMQIHYNYVYTACSVTSKQKEKRGFKRNENTQKSNYSFFIVTPLCLYFFYSEKEQDQSKQK